MPVLTKYIPVVRSLANVTAGAAADPFGNFNWPVIVVCPSEDTDPVNADATSLKSELTEALLMVVPGVNAGCGRLYEPVPFLGMATSYFNKLEQNC